MFRYTQIRAATSRNPTTARDDASALSSGFRLDESRKLLPVEGMIGLPPMVKKSFHYPDNSQLVKSPASNRYPSRSDYGRSNRGDSLNQIT